VNFSLTFRDKVADSVT